MHSFHLLLVDDHENIRFTFRLALESDGYDVDTAGTVAEARAKIERRCYDVLILDLQLGTESGLGLLEKLRAEGVDTPVLIMTAHGTTQDAIASMKLGAVDFLIKPLEPVRFRAVVAEILRRQLPSEDHVHATMNRGHHLHRRDGGVQVKPLDHLLIRPELRYDQAINGSKAFTDSTQSHQFTGGIDVVVTF